MGVISSMLTNTIVLSRLVIIAFVAIRYLPPLSIYEVVAPNVHHVLAVTIRAQGFEPRPNLSVCAAISSNGPPRSDTVLERGVVGISPPLIRGAVFLTSEELERLLVARDREILFTKRKLHVMTRRSESAESAVAKLEAETSKLREEEHKNQKKEDRLRAQIAQLEEDVRRRRGALRAANERRNQIEGKAAEQIAIINGRVRLLQTGIHDAYTKTTALARRAETAEMRAEEANDRSQEAKRRAAEEFASRLAAHRRERDLLEGARDKALQERNDLTMKLEENFRDLRELQEAERETDKVVRQLQAWRERVARGDVVEMSPVEVKRLKWSEDQVEVLKQANAALRSQLVDTARLLASAEHSFDTVREGSKTTMGTISELSTRVEEKENSLRETEKSLRRSRAEVTKLKKCVTSLHVGLMKAEKSLKDRQRGFDATKRAMVGMARGRQEEAESRINETVKRSSAERTSKRAVARIDDLRRRAEEAEEFCRELDAEKRVLLQHLVSLRDAPDSIGAAKGDEDRDINCRQTTRSLLERAISDWSVKTMFSRARSCDNISELRGGTGEKMTSAHTEPETDFPSVPRRPGFDSCSPSPILPTGLSRNGAAPADGTAELVTASVWDAGTNADRDLPMLEVVRVNRALREEGESPRGRCCWDLVVAPAEPSRSGDIKDTNDAMAGLGIKDLGQHLRDLDIGAEGCETVLNAVARAFNALILTRQLAAKQCAEVRTELARAAAQLFTRAEIISDTRAVAREVAKCSRALITRLVDMKLRHWRFSQENACNAGKEACGDSDADDKICPSFREEEISESSTIGSHEESSSSSSNGWPRRQYCSGTQVSRSQSGRWLETGDPTGKRAASHGVTLSLSYVGLQDDVLRQVVTRLLRYCIPLERTANKKTSKGETYPRERTCSPLGKPLSGDEESPAHQRGGNGAGKGSVGDEDSARNTAIPLSRLLLRGNFLTDAGALALCPLVEASPTLTTIDLRCNPIGARGVVALSKALKMNPWLHSVTQEGECGGDQTKGELVGVVLHARRRLSTTISDRARAYAFAVIPSSSSQQYRPGTSLSDPQSRLFDSEAAGSPPWSHPGRFETSDTNRDGGDGYHAPSHDIGIGRAVTSEGVPNALHRRHLHLMEDGVVERFEKIRITGGPTCRIDLRGCARRSTPLPPVGIEAEQSAGTVLTVSPERHDSVLSTGSAPPRSCSNCLNISRRRDRRLLGRRKVDVTHPSLAVGAQSLPNFSSVRERRVVTQGGESIHSADRFADLVSKQLMSTTRTPERKWQSRNRRTATATSRWLSSKAETQEVEDLKSLLSASRMMLAEADEIVSLERNRNHAAFTPITNSVTTDRRAQGDAIVRNNKIGEASARKASLGTVNSPLDAEWAPSYNTARQCSFEPRKSAHRLDSRERGVTWNHQSKGLKRRSLDGKQEGRGSVDLSLANQDAGRRRSDLLQLGKKVNSEGLGGTTTVKACDAWETQEDDATEGTAKMVGDNRRSLQEENPPIQRPANSANEGRATVSPHEDEHYAAGRIASHDAEHARRNSYSTRVQEASTNDSQNKSFEDPPHTYGAGKDVTLTMDRGSVVRPGDSKGNLQIQGRVRDKRRRSQLPSADSFQNVAYAQKGAMPSIWQNDDPSATWNHLIGNSLQDSATGYGESRKQDSRTHEAFATNERFSGDADGIDQPVRQRLSVGNAILSGGDSPGGVHLERGHGLDLTPTKAIVDVVLPGSAEKDENEPGQIVLKRIEALERAMQSR